MNLKQLAKLWNKKLKDSGFKDIEDEHGNLKVYDSELQSRISKSEYLSTMHYYERARELVHSKYLEGRDRYIWQRHAEGESNEEIARSVGLNPKSVGTIIADIARRLM
jgi:DNA-binding NarL/FixJ family response regulator